MLHLCLLPFNCVTFYSHYCLLTGKQQKASQETEEDEEAVETLFDGGEDEEMTLAPPVEGSDITRVEAPSEEPSPPEKTTEEPSPEETTEEEPLPEQTTEEEPLPEKTTEKPSTGAEVETVHVIVEEEEHQETGET